MKRLTAFDGLSGENDFSTRYDRIRQKSSFLENKWEKLARVCPDLNRASILIIGPGTGKSDLELIKKFLPHSNISTVDFGGKHFACIDSWIRCRLRDGAGFGKHEQYDIVVAQQILQHATDWRSFFYILSNLLKDKGIFVFDSFDAPIFQAVQGQAFAVSTDCMVDKWEKFFLMEYRKREYTEGIFWDPEFVSNVPSRLAKLLSLFGFEGIDVGEEVRDCVLMIDSKDLIESFINREYGPLFWGSYSEEETPVLELAMPTVEWKGLAKYQLHAYQKKTVSLNFPDLLNNIRMINNRAVLRLDTHLRYDAAIRASEVIENENFKERMLLSYIQSLLFAGAIDCSTDLFLPYLGNIKTLQPLEIDYPAKQHALINRQNYSKAINTFSHHLSLMTGSIKEQSFTDFLANKVGRPVTLTFQLYDNNIPRVEISDCDYGLLIDFYLPNDWRIDIPLDNDIGTQSGRLFSQYLYSDLKKYFENINPSRIITGSEKVAAIESTLINAIRNFQILDFSEGTLDEIGKDLAKYVYASRALWSNYKVIFYIIHQIYADRKQPALRRDSVGVGSIIILEEPKRIPSTYLDKERLGLIHVITREFASSLLFHKIGELEVQREVQNIKDKVNKTEAALFRRLLDPSKNIITHLSNAVEQAKKIRIIIDPPGSVLIDATAEHYFAPSKTKIIFAGNTIESAHDWNISSEENSKKLMGAVLLTVLTTNEQDILSHCKGNLWDYALSILDEITYDERKNKLKAMLKNLVSEGVSENTFLRLKYCFHSAFGYGGEFSPSLLFAMFHTEISSSSNIRLYLEERYILKYSIGRAIDKMSAILSLIYDVYGAERKVTIKFKPPDKDGPNSPGYVNIIAQGTYEPIHDWNKLLNQFKSYSQDITGGLISPLFKFFGKEGQQKVDRRDNKIYVQNDNDNEFIIFEEDKRIINFEFT